MALPFPRRSSPALPPAIKWAMVFVIALAGGLFSASPTARAHPNDLDEFGGHFDDKTGQYHYHRPRRDAALEKSKSLKWTTYPHRGTLTATVVRIDRPDAIWVQPSFRPVFQELADKISATHRDDKQAMIQIWPLFVSPESSVNQGERYNSWFKEQVVYELKKKLLGKEVQIHFDLDNATRRPRGMLFLGEENLNLWMVLSGWSFYVLGDEKGPYHKNFIQAEDMARRNRVGLWDKK
ncbi:MAG: thermonuclease family protein [Deltaproteobacteria bacterium]|nr:thermonuclease family protein [Deltaproteobacteria bacterium]